MGKFYVLFLFVFLQSALLPAETVDPQMLKKTSFEQTQEPQAVKPFEQAPPAEAVKPKPIIPKPIAELDKVKCKSLFEAEVDAVALSYKTNSPCTEKYYDASGLTLKAKASNTMVTYKRIDGENFIYVSQKNVLGESQTKIIKYNDGCSIESVTLNGFDPKDEDFSLTVTKEACLFIVNNYKTLQLQRKNINPKLPDISKYLTTVVSENETARKKAADKGKIEDLSKLVSHYYLYRPACQRHFEKELSGNKTPGSNTKQSTRAQ